MAKTKKIRTREVTFEGKNIHFSPLDNKPLCSFSNKLCRQRRLNGFAFCIRHILEDKSSPFKQCDYVTRNNGQRCLNAIPSNQERGYCHSHMQVAGIIPKTERKVKPVPNSNTPPNSSSKNGKFSDSKKENQKKNSVENQCSNASSTSTKVKKSPAPSKSKGKSVPPMINSSISTVKNQADAATDNLPVTLNGKSNAVVLPKKETPVPKKGKVLKKQAKPKALSTVGPTITQSKQKAPLSLGSNIGNLHLDLQFEQLKTSIDFPQTVPIIDAKLVKDEPPQLDIPVITLLDATDDFILIPPLLQLRKTNDILNGSTDLKTFGNGKCSETRQEFLSRVRSAFKSHYKMFRRACKMRENHDEGNKSFRESLLSCVLADPRISAKVLTNPQIENNCKVETITGNRNGDKGSHSSSVNFQSNNNVTAVSNNKTAVSAQHDGGIGYISSNFLRDFDENLSSEHFKESKYCDSSPWMNGGIHDTQLGNSKKTRNYNQTSKQYLAMSHLSDGKAPPHISRRNQKCSSNSTPGISNGFTENQKNRNSSHQLNGMSLGNETGVTCSHLIKKRRVDLDNDFDELDHNLGLDLEGTTGSESHLLCPSDYSSVAHFETVLNSVSSSDTAGTPEGVITDASFDSPFDHSTSSQPDCDFSDDVDLKTFELQIDPEIAHQASRLLENNELTEDDFNELFPETRSLTDHKLAGDLGIDFTTTFDADIDYSLFANIFPNFRSNNSSEVISVTQNF